MIFLSREKSKKINSRDSFSVNGDMLNYMLKFIPQSQITLTELTFRLIYVEHSPIGGVDAPFAKILQNFFGKFSTDFNSII